MSRRLIPTDFAPVRKLEQQGTDNAPDMRFPVSMTRQLSCDSSQLQLATIASALARGETVKGEREVAPRALSSPAESSIRRHAASRALHSAWATDYCARGAASRQRGGQLVSAALNSIGGRVR